MELSPPCFCLFPSPLKGTVTLPHPPRAERAGLVKQRIESVLSQVTTPGASAGGSAAKCNWCVLRSELCVFSAAAACDGVGSPVTAW